jgi:hypothetical protein
LCVVGEVGGGGVGEWGWGENGGGRKKREWSGRNMEEVINGVCRRGRGK